jgi:SP family myo-inositol transporter-like MFS transporter 13
MYRNRKDQCIEIICQAYLDVTEEQTTNKMSIETDVAQVKAREAQITITRSLKALFFVLANLRSVTTACGIMWFQRMCRFNTCMYSSSTPFDIVGFSAPIAVGTIIPGFKWNLPSSPSSLRPRRLPRATTLHDVGDASMSPSRQ